ncbi:uncharacterized protein N7506_006918 [Penicillium brevicompactum]|uniref:uncharacterized protein n=1 Tax=Penicillium brevicompactum TaxID=5074 RepID=UPI0025409EF8|nr:uncharacterized protein N7506_006918 [Penicillium brevicompactum]KAJ5333135.1 hypothetical protein N7506_006918 [Penicillium brevicompactum]
MLGTISTQLTTSPERGNMIHIGGHHLIDSLLDGGFEFPTLVPQRLETTIAPAQSDVGIEMDTSPVIEHSTDSAETFHSLSSEAEAESLVRANQEESPAPVPSPHPHGIRWMPRLSEFLDDIKCLPIGEARLLETGKTKFCNLPVIRIGLRYIPDGDDPELRTVTVTRLPVPTSLSEVLRSVRGGDVLNATMCDTVAIIGSQTALLTFTTSMGAAGFVQTARSEGFYVGFHKAHVELVTLPTYPMRRILQDRIINRGRTRALTATSANGPTKDIIYGVLSSSLVANHIEGFKDHRSQNEVTILFYSIDMAMRAFKLLCECPRITKIWFGSDPCGRTYQ